MLSIVILSLAALAPPQASVSSFRVERVFGSEIKTGPYKHPASVTELDNGDLYLVYYGGEGEYAVDTGVFGSRLPKGARKWTLPVRIASDPFRSVGNGVVWQEPGGLVHLFYVVRWGDTWSTSRIQGKVSRDGAKTWSDSYVVSEKQGMMVRGKPVILANGDILLPVYHETGFDTERVGPDSTSRFLRYDRKLRSWLDHGIIRSAKGNIQPAIAEVAPGRLIAYCRRGGGYEPVTDGYIIRSESSDAGLTWTEGRDSAFKNPNAAVDLLKLQSGKLLLVYNDSMHGRTPLTVSLSADFDKTWPHKRDIATGDFDYAYPYAIQAKDGRIHVIFTSHSRTTIQHAVFDEAWIEGRS